MNVPRTLCRFALMVTVVIVVFFVKPHRMQAQTAAANALSLNIVFNGAAFSNRNAAVSLIGSFANCRNEDRQIT